MRFVRPFLLALGLVSVVAHVGHAQLLDAKIISLAAAKKMLAAAEAEARSNNWSVSIAIVDASGNLLAFQKLDDASLPSIDVAQAKARTAARYRRPTRGLDSAVTAGRMHYLAFPGMIPLEGGVPVIAHGKVIGGIGVSGVSSAQDAQIAAAGARALAP